MTPVNTPTVLLLHPSNELYGADRQLLAIIDAIDGLVRPVVVLPNDLPYRGALSERLTQRGVAVEVGPLAVVRRRYLLPRALPRWIVEVFRGWLWVVGLARRERAVAIVSNSAAIFVGPLTAATLRLPHLWCMREIIDRPHWFAPLVRLIIRASRSRVIAVSQAVAQWVAPSRRTSVTVIHDGVDITEATEQWPERPTAAFVGRLNAWKGHGKFLEMAGAIHARMPSARFVLVGGPVPGDEGFANELRAQTLQLDPEGSWLQWLGELPDARTAMRDAWVVVVPSLRPDPFPNVVLEAMAEARAVVGSASGGIPQMVVDGETGRLVPPGDVVALAEAVSELLSDPAKAQSYGSAGHQRVKRHFSGAMSRDEWRHELASLVMPIRDRSPAHDRAAGLSDPPPTPGQEPPDGRGHLVEWNAEKIARYWDYLSGVEEREHFGAVYAPVIAGDVARHAAKTGTVLDVGCGLGHLIGQLHDKGFQVMGIDSSPETVAAARQRLPGVTQDALLVGPMTALPIPDRSVDTVVLSEVVEHTLETDLTPTLTEAYRVLRPGGHLVITTPNAEVLEHEYVQCPGCGAQFHRWQHVRRWTSTTLVATLEVHGFGDLLTEERRLAPPTDTRDDGIVQLLRSTLRGHRRRLRCPDCGRTFSRSIPVRLRATWHRRRVARPHLLAVASRPNT